MGKHFDETLFSVLCSQIAIKADFPFMKVHAGHLHILPSLKFICL